MLDNAQPGCRQRLKTAFSFSLERPLHMALELKSIQVDFMEIAAVALQNKARDENAISLRLRRAGRLSCRQTAQKRVNFGHCKKGQQN
jgi:hypothetical protein